MCVTEEHELATFQHSVVHKKFYALANVLFVSVRNKHSSLTEHDACILRNMRIEVVVTLNANHRHPNLVAEQHKVAQSVAAKNKVVGRVDNRDNPYEIIRAVMNIGNNC